MCHKFSHSKICIMNKQIYIVFFLIFCFMFMSIFHFIILSTSVEASSVNTISNIADWNQFVATVDAYDSSYYAKDLGEWHLTEDIDFAGAELDPIDFKGCRIRFFGEGHTLSNFKITGGALFKNSGICGSVGGGHTENTEYWSCFVDLRISNAIITGSGDVALIIPQIDSTHFSYCYANNIFIDKDVSFSGYNTASIMWTGLESGCELTP